VGLPPPLVKTGEDRLLMRGRLRHVAQSPSTCELSNHAAVVKVPEGRRSPREPARLVLGATSFRAGPVLICRSRK